MIKSICSDGLTERINRLPAWAREHIEKLTREREVAVNALNEFLDNQTPSKIFHEEWLSTGERQGPSDKRHYVQTDALRFEHAGIRLDVNIFTENRIKLQWQALDHRKCTYVALIPMGVELYAKENMR